MGKKFTQISFHLPASQKKEFKSSAVHFEITQQALLERLVGYFLSIAKSDLNQVKTILMEEKPCQTSKKEL